RRVAEEELHAFERLRGSGAHGRGNREALGIVAGAGGLNQRKTHGGRGQGGQDFHADSLVVRVSGDGSNRGGRTAPGFSLRGVRQLPRRASSRGSGERLRASPRPIGGQY